VPNLIIMAPADENECRQMLYTALASRQPAVVRYPRGSVPGVPIESQMSAVPIGKAEIRRNGTGVAIFAVGPMVASCQGLAAAQDWTLVNLRFVKPLDVQTVLALAGEHEALVTVEEDVVAGGAGSAIDEALAAADVRLPVLNIGIPDRFIEHGSREDCLASAGLDRATLEQRILDWWQAQFPAAAMRARLRQRFSALGLRVRRGYRSDSGRS
jgi:1-deoxy-D-xylulose-5-phosphate synthase